MTRQAILEAIRSNPNVSVLIVGGGINGIGVFRELALQGVDVLLAERSDFCSGASAASSHMAHGGLRYLENGEFRLVREALTERNLLLLNAPHYVAPLPTTVPIFRWFSGLFNAPLKFLNLRDKPGERGALVIRIGLLLYDWFARNYRTMPTHDFEGRKGTLKQFPLMNPAVRYTATYYDARMSIPERIAMELILDVIDECPQARAVNYMSVSGGRKDAVTLRDELAGETLEIKPQIVVNAAGPWIDLVTGTLGLQTQFIGGTKGSHLVVDHPALREAIGDHEIFFENQDGRIVLIFPLLDRVLIGTTDIRIDHPDDARCTEEETDYILGMLPRVFPTLAVDHSHIVFRFSGVRPLPYADVDTPGQISRDHSIQVIEPGPDLDFPILSLVGGKWTTFRAFSEQVADKVLKRLGRTRRLDTHDLPIGGGRNYPKTDEDRQAWLAKVSRELEIDRARLEILFNRYGTRAREIARFICAGEDAPLRHQPDYSRREIMFIAEQEMVIHLDDLILRRSLLAMLGKVNAALLDELAEILASALEWSEAQTRDEIKRATEILRDRHGVELS
jgi:glycerol-3-phosphate dehydrogenase